MRGNLLALALFGLAGSTLVRADGLLIPTDRGVPPLRLIYQRIELTIEGHVATTKVEQSYHNSTDRDLEAEFIFPLPAGASVRDFSMWVGGKRYRGEAIDAPKARQTYEDIVRRLKVREAWVDQAFKPSTPTLRLRVLGKAYFRILSQHPELSPIFALGNQVTWVSPSGTALVIANQGQDAVTDATLDRLFARPE